MQKFPKIRYPSDPETDGVLAGEAVVTEKLDGANFGWSWSDGTLDIRTKNVEYPDALNNEDLPKTFRHAVEYLDEVVPDEVRTNDLLTQFTYFGEAMHYHSLKYEDVEYVTPQSGSPYFGEGYPNVVMFDAYNEAQEEWVEWDMMHDLSEELQVPLTEVLARGPGEELKKNGDLAIPEESMFGGPPEGIVVRRVDGLVRAKKVSDDFKEKNAQAFNDPSKAEGDATKFVAAFITDTRVEKQIDKLVDEGEFEAPAMDMMEGGLLVRRVVQDVFEEVGWSELLCGDFEAEWDDDFKSEVRSKASQKCVNVLRTKTQEF